MTESSTPKNSLQRPSHLARFSDLFNKILDVGLLVDNESYIVRDVNIASERVFNRSFDELVGRSILRFIEEAEKDDFSKALRIARRRHHPYQFICRWKDPNHCLIVMQTVACNLKLSDGSEIMQVIAKDISREYEAEQKASQYLKDLKEANAKLEALAITDEMTKVYNFRYFKSRLLEEHERSQRYWSSYSIIFCDVDHFKIYNDLNGHMAGDAVLQQIGVILKSNCRTTDIPARYGGEEFAILCSGVSQESAAVLAERIRGIVERQPFPNANKQPLSKVTLSLGVASFPGDGSSPDEILQAADKALYTSKSEGRNKVTLSNQIREKLRPFLKSTGT